MRRTQLGARDKKLGGKRFLLDYFKCSLGYPWFVNVHIFYTRKCAHFSRKFCTFFAETDQFLNKDFETVPELGEVAWTSSPRTPSGAGDDLKGYLARFRCSKLAGRRFWDFRKCAHFLEMCKFFRILYGVLRTNLIKSTACRYWRLQHGVIWKPNVPFLDTDYSDL